MRNRHDELAKTEARRLNADSSFSLAKPRSRESSHVDLASVGESRNGRPSGSHGCFAGNLGKSRNRSLLHSLMLFLSIAVQLVVEGRDVQISEFLEREFRNCGNFTLFPFLPKKVPRDVKVWLNQSEAL